MVGTLTTQTTTITSTTTSTSVTDITTSHTTTTTYTETDYTKTTTETKTLPKNVTSSVSSVTVNTFSPSTSTGVIQQFVSSCADVGRVDSHINQTPTSTSSATSAGGAGRHTNLALITGGIVGGLFGVLGVAFLVWFFLKNHPMPRLEPLLSQSPINEDANVQRRQTDIRQNQGGRGPKPKAIRRVVGKLRLPASNTAQDGGFTSAGPSGPTVATTPVPAPTVQPPNRASLPGANSRARLQHTSIRQSRGGQQRPSVDTDVFGVMSELVLAPPPYSTQSDV